MTDQDLPALTLSPDEIDTDEGDTATYTVTLAEAPAADLTVTVTSADTGALTASPAMLPFTTTTWSVPQTVTLTTVADNDALDEWVDVRHGTTIGGESSILATLTARVTDSSSAPSFIESSPRRFVDEHSPAGTAVGSRVRATDGDRGDTLTYTLSGVDASFFRNRRGVRPVADESRPQSRDQVQLLRHRYGYGYGPEFGRGQGDDRRRQPGRTRIDQLFAVRRRDRRDVDRSGRRCERRELAMGQVFEPLQRVGEHQRRHLGPLHAHQRRRGHVPAGHGVLQRRAWFRQDRAGREHHRGPPARHPGDHARLGSINPLGHRLHARRDDAVHAARGRAEQPPPRRHGPDHHRRLQRPVSSGARWG